MKLVKFSILIILFLKSSSVSCLNNGVSIRVEPVLQDLDISDRCLTAADIYSVHKIIKKMLTQQVFNNITSKANLAEMYKMNNIFSFEMWTLTKGWRNLPVSEDGDCVLMSESILRKIPQELHAQIIPSIIPAKYRDKNGPKLHHVAVLIKYKYLDDDFYSYMLMDPGFFISEPVVLNENEKSKKIKTERGDWTFVLDDNVIHCYAEHFGVDKNANSPDCVTYQLKKFYNYYDHVEQVNVLSNLAPALVIVNESGFSIARIVVELEHHRLIWILDRGRKNEINFDDLLKNGFPQDFDDLQKYLGNKIDAIKSQILTIINAREKLLSIEKMIL
jgi:hypothetical protein